MKAFRGRGAVVAIIALLIFTGCAANTVALRSPNNIDSEKFSGGSGRFKRVFVIVLENTDYSLALSQPNLAEISASGALLTNYFALFHPSEPNYLAMITGTNASILDDGQYSLDITSIADLLEKKNLTWKAYAEDYSGNCARGDSGVDPYIKIRCEQDPAACARACSDKSNPSHCWPLFADRHVPFLSMKNITSDPGRCNSHIVPDSKFRQVLNDVENGALPNFSFYTPNLDNDGHNFGSSDGVQWADKNWLGPYLKPLLANPKFMQDTLVVITFDEDGDEDNEGQGITTPGQKNRILTVLYGDAVRAGSVSSIQYTHLSLLRTIEDSFGLGRLGTGDTGATPIQEIWKKP